MKKIIYNKLIRDRIPEIIAKNNRENRIDKNLKRGGFEKKLFLEYVKE